LESQPGVKNIVLSGMRATVVMEEGVKLDEAKVKEAIVAKRLKFVSMEVVNRPVPVAMFNMAAKGVT
jgi:hypothetical protein